MSTTTKIERNGLIVASYAPYNKLHSFLVGLRATIDAANPYDSNTVDAQAFDRGQECKMRLQRGA